MPSGPLSKFTAKTAQEVCARFELSDEAKALARSGQTPAQCLDALVDKQLFPDAIRFLAHGLPKREAVWWACFCAKTAGTTLAAAEAAALQRAERWVADPSEDNRQATMPAAEAAKLGTPAGCAALAAFLSGGSMGPANVAAIPPAETLSGNAVAGAVMIAVVVKEPQKATEKYRTFIGRGIEIANGKNLWK
jgi:uncharacterized protein DUF6931